VAVCKAMKNCEGAARCDLEDDPATWAVQTVSRAAVLCRSVELCCTNCHHDPGRLFRLDLGTMGLRSCFRSCTAPYTLIALMQLFQLRAGQPREPKCSHCDPPQRTKLIPRRRFRRKNRVTGLP